MIKFNFLIHKETGTVIKYEDWLEKYKIDMWSFFTDKSKGRQFSYKPKDILFSNEFEIIYNSEFTTEEIRNIYLGMNDKTICNKSMKLIEKSEYIKDKYGIEV